MMVLAKILLLLLALGFGYWLWRVRRQQAVKPPPRPPAKQAAEPQPMARCAHCDVHMARADMVSGHLGLYCSAAHRQAHGDQATH